MTAGGKALVFDVQRFSIHDGPGIRTVVFFKGCGLDCLWCQNPEAVHPRMELAYYEERCLPECRLCVDVCPEDAIRDAVSERVDFDRCTVCGKCGEVCPATALVTVGREVTAEALFAEVTRDRAFFVESGGGVTLSGGEPVRQAAFLEDFLPMLRAADVHVALETAGFYSFDLLRGILPYIDLVLFDIKVIDGDRHRKLTGRGNERIHDNLKKLLGTGMRVRVRMPVIPGLNTDDANLEAVAGFLRDVGVREVTLLPYNHLWEAKLPRLATNRTPLGIGAVAPEDYRGVRDALNRRGVHAHL